MDGSNGHDGSLLPFRPLVLDADGGSLVPRPTGRSGGTRKLRALADAPATLRAYAADWRHFGLWCHKHSRRPFDGTEQLETIVGDYLAAIHETLAISTLRRRVAAIVR